MLATVRACGPEDSFEESVLSLPPTFMWVLSIELRLLGFDGQHLYPLSHPACPQAHFFDVRGITSLRHGEQHGLMCDSPLDAVNTTG